MAQTLPFATLEAMAYTAAAALFFNGICLLLFALAIFYLLQTKTVASRIFIAASVVLVIFALTQVIVDVVLAHKISQLVQSAAGGATSDTILSLESSWAYLYRARQALTVTNNAISDCIFLYRCAAVWASSHYRLTFVAIPAFLVLTTMVLGYISLFVIAMPLNAPFIMAFITNLVLLGLTAGRIWRKGREATLLLGARAGARYTTTIAIICESSLLYVLTILIYLIAVNVVGPAAPVPSVAWGALPQIFNIIPLMIMVRVGMARAFAETQDSHGSVPLSSAANAPLMFKPGGSEYSERPSGAYSGRGAYSKVDG
ncbi:hypothetical protein B0H17DRAFT_1031649 [Mycena rosella]|uniref:Uncharacterized protein n=1 Tax=Mycena rosella TaxID=1033263 RepID=A0AAD7GYX4_MYCRO|nr:hypothetical protein B0H17DRAFT_1031649 [Mycena rosella]